MSTSARIYFWKNYFLLSCPALILFHLSQNTLGWYPVLSYLRFNRNFSIKSQLEGGCCWMVRRGHVASIIKSCLMVIFRFLRTLLFPLPPLIFHLKLAAIFIDRAVFDIVFFHWLNKAHPAGPATLEISPRLYICRTRIDFSCFQHFLLARMFLWRSDCTSALSIGQSFTWKSTNKIELAKQSKWFRDITIVLWSIWW